MSKKLIFVCFISMVMLVATRVGPSSISKRTNVAIQGPTEVSASIPAGQAASDASTCLDYDPDLKNFTITSTILHDAYDTDSTPCLEMDPKPPKGDIERIKLQRVYDMFSWQSFLAISWPVDPHCTGEHCTQDKLTYDSGIPRWATWKERYEVFKEDGSKPEVWHAPRTTIPPTTPALSTTLMTSLDKSTRILYLIKQANSELPLWDQNGNIVYYEILMNETLFDDITSQELYHLQGQINLYKERDSGSGPLRIFTWGNVNRAEVGAIALKLAWKIIDESKDNPERFYTMPAYVLVRKDANNWECDNENGANCEWQPRTVGLVGLHIAHKTFSSNQWVWSTFEHIDNVQVNDLEVVAYAENGKTLKPSFNNLSCETCPVNVEPEPSPDDGLRKTQVMRVIPISEATAQLNDQVHELLPADSVWRYYELVGTQYASAPADAPVPPDNGLASLTNNSGGKPEPVYLVNSVLETYDQKGNQPIGNLVESSREFSSQMVFGTQSCMGCHYTAGFAVANSGDIAFRLPGQGEFSFLLENAHWQK